MKDLPGDSNALSNLICFSSDGPIPTRFEATKNKGKLIPELREKVIDGLRPSFL
jgi:hypothetical protein